MRARNMAKNAIFHGKMLFNKSSENAHTGTSKYKVHSKECSQVLSCKNQKNTIKTSLVASMACVGLA
jgi:hypothetical protein